TFSKKNHSSLTIQMEKDQWNTTLGGTEGDGALSVIQTSDGGLTLGGWTASYGAGESDIWLVKTDSHGQYEWDTTFGGTKDEFALSVIQTSDEGFALVGRTYSYGAGGSDIWLVKMDSHGQHEWDTTFGGTKDEYGGSLIQTSDGGFVLVGWTESYGAGGSDIWLIKFYDSANATTPGFTYLYFLATLSLIPLINHKRRKRQKEDYL
ncbi:MAG: hypothetical protein ACFFFH_08750, partial [Candidatus Thorarchaeota archaeon]